MTRLSNKRVKFIVKRVSGGEATVKQLAGLYGVSIRRVQQLVKQYKETGAIPQLKKERRPKTFLTEEQKVLICKAYEESRVGARLLQYDIRKRFKVNIPHNKIHAFLKETGQAWPDSKKQKQRKYCRYERKHSLSLVHIDWYETGHGIKLLPVLDDASRKILAAGEFSALSTENAMKVLKQAIGHAKEYKGFIRELNSDRDTTFMTTKRKPILDSHRFQQLLRRHDIKFIPSRRRHPQTNGKTERWFQEYEKHRSRFKTLKQFINWYNNRLHGSLDLSTAETPNEAFAKKLQPECILGLFYQNIAGKKK